MASPRTVDVTIQFHPDVLRTSSQRKILDDLARRKIIFKKETLRQRFQTDKLKESDIKRNLLRVLQRDFAIFYARGKQWQERLQKDGGQIRKAQKEMQETWKECVTSAQAQLKSWAEDMGEDQDEVAQVKDPKRVAQTLTVLMQLEKKLLFLKNIEAFQRDVHAKIGKAAPAAREKLITQAARALESLYKKHHGTIETLKIAQTLFEKKIDTDAKDIQRQEKSLARGAKELWEDITESQEGIDDFIAFLEDSSGRSGKLADFSPQVEARTVKTVVRAARALHERLKL